MTPAIFGALALVMIVIGLMLIRRARAVDAQVVNLRRTYLNAVITLGIGLAAIVPVFTPSASRVVLIVIAALSLTDLALSPVLGARRRR